MKGKVFSDSLNVHQDQARVLYDYFYQAAEKIVAQEVAIEKDIQQIEQKMAALTAEKEKAALWKWILCILIIPFIINHLKEKRLEKEIAELAEKIISRKKDHAAIFRDYQVNRLGVGYVPVARQIRFDNRSFILDLTGKTPKTEIKLQISRQNELMIEKLNELEELSKSGPLVESSEEIEEVDAEMYSRSLQKLNQHDYFGRLDRNLRTISFCMEDLEVSAVELPLVSDKSDYFKFLQEYASEESESVKIPVFDASAYDKDISRFEELNRLKDSLSRESEEFEDVLKKLMVTMAGSVQAISSLKVASVNKLILETNSILYTVLKAPYNHYSPVLEASEIERIGNESFNFFQSVDDYVPFRLKKSSQMKYNLLTGAWVAEDGSTVAMPFGVHQLYEEIVAPMVQNLMQENRLERLKIYNHIKDQKINYLNQWHKEMMDFYGRNRAESADLINHMRNSLREYVAAYNTLDSLRKTEETMAKSEGSLDQTVVKAETNSAESFAAFEQQSAEFQAVQVDFEQFMDRLKDDIDEKAAKFEHMEYYDALLSDEHFKDSSVAMNEMNQLDDRRRPLALVNPLFARSSELLPTPEFEPVMEEHFSINLPGAARNAFRELEEELIAPPPPPEQTPEPQAEPSGEGEPSETADQPAPQDPGSVAVAEQTPADAAGDIEFLDEEAPEETGSETEEDIEFEEDDDDVEFEDDDEEDESDPQTKK